MKKKIDRSLIISTILCLAPIILSMAIYDKLPGQIAIHWNSAGNPDNYVPKAVAAFGLPVFFAALNVFNLLVLANDPKRANASRALRAVVKWAICVLAVILQPITLFIAMGAKIPIHIVVMALVGAVLVICGNYLPKCRQNYAVGIKLPWTLNSAENWNRTHRLAGYVWVLGGILMIVNTFLALWYAAVVIIFLLAVIPFVYSFVLYKKGI